MISHSDKTAEEYEQKMNRIGTAIIIIAIIIMGIFFIIPLMRSANIEPQFEYPIHNIDQAHDVAFGTIYDWNSGNASLTDDFEYLDILELQFHYNFSHTFISITFSQLIEWSENKSLELWIITNTTNNLFYLHFYTQPILQCFVGCNSSREINEKEMRSLIPMNIFPFFNLETNSIEVSFPKDYFIMNGSLNISAYCFEIIANQYALDILDNSVFLPFFLL